MSTQLRLNRGFFARPTADVAEDLLGAYIVVDPGGGPVTARLVETEAYLGTEDPGSHAARGPTPRSAIMFGEVGRLYVYLSYGVHVCANIVAHDGRAGAVLLRAAMVEPSGEEAVRRRRSRVGVATDRLLSGPGNLTAGLGITLADNRIDVCRSSRCRIVGGGPVHVAAGPRIGLSKGAGLPLRFRVPGHIAVSGRRT